MKNHFIPITFLIAATIISCEKEDSYNYDCFKSYICYNENNESCSQEKYYYRNGLIIKIDCSPRYIWTYTYDSKGNLTNFESEQGSYFLHEYDSENRCIKTEQYVDDTLCLITLKFYSDTMLIKEIFLREIGDTLYTAKYFYNAENKLDSIIADKSKTYYYYSLNSNSVIKLNNNNKYFESITTFENGLTSKYEEFYYTENGELYKSYMESKDYDDDKNLVKIVIEQFDLYSSSNQYDEIRYLYDSIGRILKSESYDENGNLLKYIEFIYSGDDLVKKQSFAADGNKTGYTIIENNCND